MTDVAIIGSGVTGLSAAIYAGRYELSTIVIGDILGGATAIAWTVENYPGFESIDGYDLVIKMRDQAEKVGAKVISDKAVDIKKIDGGFEITTESGEKIATKTITLAGGAARRKLNLPKENEFSQGKGVHYCATCDGPLYKGKTIAIVGGGNAAIKGVNLSAQYTEKIYLIVRKDVLRADPVDIDNIQKFIKSGKLEILYNTEVKEILGDERLAAVKLSTGKELKIDGLFVEIGAMPEVVLAQKLGVKLDERGYVVVNNLMETNVTGIYAAGDTTNFFGDFKQIVSGCAMGAVAVTSAFKHIGK